MIKPFLKKVSTKTALVLATYTAIVAFLGAFIVGVVGATSTLIGLMSSLVAVPFILGIIVLLTLLSLSFLFRKKD